MKKIFTLLFIAASPALFSQTAITLTVTVPYQQNFNTLISTGNANWVDTITLGGWYASENNIYADDGNDVFGGRLHSYGGANGSERALGSKSFSSLSGVEYGVRMKNASNNPINYFQISYRGEQWRQNTNNVDVKFYYQVNATSLTTGTWIPVPQLYFPALHTGTASALDGNLAVNDTTFLNILTLTLGAGQHVWFKWEHIGNSSSPGLAIDDLEIIPYATSPTAVAEVQGSSLQLHSYYNGSNGSVLLHGNFSEEDVLSVRLYDSFGKCVRILSENVSAGSDPIRIDAGALSKGIYFISAQGRKNSYWSKLAVY